MGDRARAVDGVALSIDPGFWSGRRVFVTGHTGFKGAWLTLWLRELGAEVFGFALPPPDERYLFAACGLQANMHSRFGDVRDLDDLVDALNEAAPDVIFHLAAQPLVRRSYREPVETFGTNVMGTVNLLEAARKSGSAKAVIVVTSDKCYDGRGPMVRPYEEGDALGGSGDPYSASKACAEIVARAYGASWMTGERGGLSLATVRAGNVIGGGDYAEDRIVPDAVASLSRGDVLAVRNPRAVRPWQHVLEPLCGYLMLAERLCDEGSRWTGAWNFGPADADAVPVAVLADKLVEAWGSGAWRAVPAADGLHEAPTLQLNSGKARDRLGWRPRLSLTEAVALTMRWYRAAQNGGGARLERFSIDQIHAYEELVPAA